MEEARECTIEDLDSTSLQRVFSTLSADELVHAACVKRQWRDVAFDDRLWRRLYINDWGGSQAPDPCQQIDGTYREAYLRWERELAPYRDCKDLVRRANKVWTTILRWYEQHLPHVSRSVRPGASEDEVNQVESELGVKFPTSLRVLWRLHNGQQLCFDDHYDTWFQGLVSGTGAQEPLAVDESAHHGLLGGYTFYDQKACTRLLSLPRILLWTNFLRQHMPDWNPKLVVIAGSYNMLKLFVLDCETGALKVSNTQAIHLFSAVPPNESGEKDDVLRWLEAFANNLGASAYQLSEWPIWDGGWPEQRRSTIAKGLNLFPEIYDCGMREHITQGVRVRVSAVFVPERSMPRRRFFFSYSVRFYLLPTAEQQALGLTPVQTVQLQRRQWYIRNATGEVVDEVEGPGVVGEFPVLKEGVREFVYQSCTQSSDEAGSMDGCFTFVPGSTQRPEGAIINAICPNFELKVPTYIF